MKKLLLFFALILVVLTACIYGLIPSRLAVSSAQFIRCNSRMAGLNLLDKHQWIKWWPGKTPGNYNGNLYTIKNKSPYAATIEIQMTDGTVYESLLDLVLYKNDSTGIEWKFESISGNNPITRFLNYRKAVHLKTDMKALLNRFNQFSSDEKNLYGINVEKRKFTDTFMISTQKTMPTMPVIQDIYTTIDLLNKYATENGAKAVNAPMLNIEPLNPLGYTLKMALPINKQIPSAYEFHFRFMIQGNTLFTSVKGGQATVDHAIQQMRDYISDYHFSSPAIPFQSLVTDRSKNPDTIQWITNIYYPVM